MNKNRVMSKIVSMIMGVVMCMAMLVVLPEESRVSAASNSEIRAEMVRILYNGSGGTVSCDFDGYVNTSGRHEGIDFSNYKGAPIYSLIDGEVIRVDNSSSLSTLAIYDATNNKTVLYLHADISVSAGTTIRRGQLVGYESTRGTSSAHTHIEMRSGRQQYASKSVNDYTLDNENPYSYWGKVMFEDINSLPMGHIDSFGGGIGKIHASGWGLDPDDAGASARIDIYLWNVDDRTSPVASGSVTANTYRPDVGYGDYHGFEAEIPVSVPTGTYYLGAAVIDTEGGDAYWLDGGNVSVTQGTVTQIGEDFKAMIINAKTGKLVTASYDGTAKMYSQYANTSMTANKFTWHFMQAGDGSYGIYTYYGGKALEVANASDADGAGILTTKDSAQRWYLVKSGNYYMLRPKCSGTRCLTVANNSQSDGAALQLNGEAASASQLFIIKDLSTDTAAPEITSIKASDISNAGYTLTITCDDTNGVKGVSVTTTSWKGTDAKTYTAKQTSNTTWTVSVKTADFGTYGAFYNKVLVSDYAGNTRKSSAQEVKAGVYTVKFDGNQGSVSETSRTVVYSYLYSRNAALPVPTRTGYTFTGWYTAKTGGTKITDSTKVTLTADQTLYAQWKANTYTVTFDSNGGNAVTPATKIVTYGSTYGTLPIPERNGYSFDGWYTYVTDGKKVTESTKVGATFDLKLYALWTKNQIAGDVTDDGILGVTDAVMMQKYLLNAGTMTAPAKGDLTSDGMVNAFDLAVLKRMLLEE